MSYAPKRPHISRRVRDRIFAREHGICYLCGQPITDGKFDADHRIPRELGGSDGEENLYPAHPPCHKAKTKKDVKEIAKSNRVRKAEAAHQARMAGEEPAPSRRKVPIKSRGFQKGPKQKITSRPFPKRHKEN